MEARAQYGPWQERPRLTVVHDAGASYSALPHAVLFSDLTDGAVRMYAVLQSHWWGNSGECTASHATLADEIGKKERTVRALLRELVDAGVVAERHLGRGQAKAYRAADAAPSGKNLPVGSGNDLPVRTPKRQKSASQPAKNGRFKRQKSAAPIEEDSGKKKQEEERGRTDVRPAGEPSAQGRVIDLIVAGGAPAPTFGGRAGKAVKSGGDPETIAAAYLAVWRGEWGDEWLRDNLSIHAVVDRLDGFRLWRREQPMAASSNGAGSKLTPPTDDDRALWGRALDDLRGEMRAANVDTYLAPLQVGGRLEDGGLCLIVPPTLSGSSMLGNFRGSIRRALLDAGDPHAGAVAFKARRMAQEDGR